VEEKLLWILAKKTKKEKLKKKQPTTGQLDLESMGRLYGFYLLMQKLVGLLVVQKTIQKMFLVCGKESDLYLDFDKKETP
jgi:hypothetical protein